MAAARQEQVEIRRRHGDDPSQTPGFNSPVALHEISQGAEEATSQSPLQPASSVLSINPALPENQPSLPRRRGRPPKNASAENPPPGNRATAIPRRRGRPPKPRDLPTDSVATEDSPPENKNPTVPLRQGRSSLPRRSVGRPRKHSLNRQLQSFDSPHPVLSSNMEETPLPLEGISPLESNNQGIPRRGRPPIPRRSVGRPRKHSPDRPPPVLSGNMLETPLSLKDISPLESNNQRIPRRGRPPLPKRSVGRPRKHFPGQRLQNSDRPPAVLSGNIQETPLSLEDMSPLESNSQRTPHRGRPPLPRRSVGRPRKHSSNQQLQNFDRPHPALSGNVREPPLPLEDISIKQKGGEDEILPEM